MSAPTYQLVHKEIQNPHASAPLIIPLMVLCNTSDEDLERNIRDNAARDLPWLASKDAHAGVAIVAGGGPSLADQIEEIRWLQQNGATVLAINAASRWLRDRNVAVDYQIIADAKPETASLVDQGARCHLFSSQVNAKTMEAAPRPIVWHPALEDVERLFPEARVKRGGYVLLGGGHTGNAALCIAYALGFRTLHVFGLDSSHRAGRSHCYAQPMNDFIPTVDVEWAGRVFTASVAMKAQAERFQITARAVEKAGCLIEVHGDGLLPHMWRSKPEHLSERDKYRQIWQFDTYREVAPGELVASAFLDLAKPSGVIVDFGCGTGRAGLAFVAAGLDVLLVDFADNCRDEEAMSLPFLEWDLTRPMSVRAPYGFCADVMEHIPPGDVDRVLANIIEAAERVFFCIALDEDHCGALIDHPLHLSLFTHEEWRRRIAQYATVLEEAHGENKSVFYVERK